MKDFVCVSFQGVGAFTFERRNRTMKTIRVFSSILFAACLLAGYVAWDSAGFVWAQVPTQEIPLLTFDEAHPWKTEIGSNYGLLLGPEERMPKVGRNPTVSQTLVWNNGDPYLSLQYKLLLRPHIFAGLWLSVFGHVDDKHVIVPREITKRLKAVRFQARSQGEPIRFKLEAKTSYGRIIKDQRFEATQEWQTMQLPLASYQASDLKELVFVLMVLLWRYRSHGNRQ